jgi:hypothetical protein
MVLAARKDHSAAEGILTLLADQPGLQEKLQGIAEVAEMRAQVSTARIANAEFLDQGGIVYPTLRQVVNAFGMAVQFELIKTGGVFEQLGCGCELLPQVGDTLAEGEMLRKLHQANQVPAAAAAMAVEQILARVDIEGRMGFLMQGTESDELGASAGAVSGPVVPLQVLEQWNALFEPFQILAHGGTRSPKPKLRTLGPSSQARMVGQ